MQHDDDVQMNTYEIEIIGIQKGRLLIDAQSESEAKNIWQLHLDEAEPTEQEGPYLRQIKLKQEHYADK